MNEETNLWKETMLHLAAYGLTWDDVEMIWMLNDFSWTDDPPEKWQITKENFQRLAEDTFYDNGYGGAEIYEGLHMKGHSKDGTPFMIFRNEYDGSEWWETHFLYTDLPVREVTSLGNLPFGRNIHSKHIYEV